ncbi:MULTISPECIES: DUF7019 family protein [Streptomyces]|uniref:SAVMC3_10250 family protein n=1 Tax=Streptomyces flaveolus TaxID=67297 RepID=A0ABV3AK08_9ACTN|nr:MULTISPECIES: SAVMC3_10250 family protein [Streptomyces]KMS79449.1 hypothetical protein ACZ91_62550 [Streptomyces regensis]KOG67151.1 hypothetical protein ADK77_16440 [Streptomyces antibioticus]
MTVRYYLYISDSKVDMLLSQIDPAFGRRSTTEAGLSVKLFNVRRSVEAPAPDRTAKLERVLRHLEETGQIGSVDDPAPYFRGSLPMQWGPLQGDNGGALVYFGGRTERTILGLGGASGHVLGASAPQSQEFAPSSVPTLLAGLASAFAADSVELPAEESSLAWVHTAGRLLRGPRQPVEFVARRLLAGPSPYPELDARPGMRVLLGSPLYVAMAD